jgi:hypothetical protein
MKIWRAALLLKCTGIILRMTLLFQQRSVIRYDCLRGKTNAQMVTKLDPGYHQDAPRLRATEKWEARFRADRETVEDDEDDERPGRPSQNDLGEAVLRFLEKQLHSSSREISKALYSSWTIIFRVSDDIGLRFFAPRWISHRLSDVQKVDRVELSQHMLDMMQGLGPKQEKYLPTGDESWIYWNNQRRGMWTQDRDELPPNVKRTISPKGRWFLLIDHAVVLFPLNSFRWSKSTTRSSSLKRFYRALRRNLWSVI